MRRKIITLFICLFIVAVPAWAQPRGALFKATAAGHTLYLFGTMHVGLPEFYPLEPQIENAVKKAHTLALEIDPQPDPTTAAAAMREFGMLKPGAQGYEALPENYRERLKGLLQRAKMDYASATTLRPTMLAMVLALNEYGLHGYRPDLAVDTHLAKVARANKVKVVELESLGGQLALFTRLSTEDQWRFLQETIDAMESGKQDREILEIIGAWSRADQAALEAIAAHAEADTSLSGKFVQQVLLDSRNGPIADKLKALLESEDAAVAAIGVLHLVGKNSVPAQLHARGVKVERIY